MHYHDLSLYHNLGAEPDTLNVGWLDREPEYPQGHAPDHFLKRLWAFCREPVNLIRGFHNCELCSEPSFGLRIQRDDEELWLGSAEIRVFSREGTTYAAPDLIYHYVVDHHYLPPSEFVQAVLEGPLPGSPEYLAHADKFEWGRMAARERRFRDRGLV